MLTRELVEQRLAAALQAALAAEYADQAEAHGEEHERLARALARGISDIALMLTDPATTQVVDPQGAVIGRVQ